MWFRRRHRSAGALLSPGFAADDAAESMPQAARPRLPPMAAEPAVWYRQTRQFKPAARQLVRNLVIGPAASGAVNAAYNLLRTQILRRLRDNGWNTIAVTSPTVAAGTTLTALNLAISLARDLSHTVLLVELNLANPSLCNRLGFAQRQGVVDHLLRDVPIADLLINPGIDRLVVMPAGPQVANTSELLASPRMARLVQELKSRYERRIILFDLPSVLAMDDAMAFSPLVDCALLVIEEGSTKVSEVRRALDYMGSTNLLGVVLNRSIEARTGAGPAAQRDSPSRFPALTEQTSLKNAAEVRRPDRGLGYGRGPAEPWAAPGSRESTS